MSPITIVDLFQDQRLPRSTLIQCLTADDVEPIADEIVNKLTGEQLKAGFAVQKINRVRIDMLDPDRRIVLGSLNEYGVVYVVSATDGIVDRSIMRLMRKDVLAHNSHLVVVCPYITLGADKAYVQDPERPLRDIIRGNYYIDPHLNYEVDAIFGTRTRPGLWGGLLEVYCLKYDGVVDHQQQTQVMVKEWLPTQEFLPSYSVHPFPESLNVESFASRLCEPVVTRRGVLLNLGAAPVDVGEFTIPTMEELTAFNDELLLRYASVSGISPDLQVSVEPRPDHQLDPLLSDDAPEMPEKATGVLNAIGEAMDNSNVALATEFCESLSENVRLDNIAPGGAAIVQAERVTDLLDVVRTGKYDRALVSSNGPIINSILPGGATVAATHTPLIPHKDTRSIDEIPNDEIVKKKPDGCQP